VKQAIVSGELPPGAKLSPSSIAADLGVSHIPVREALASMAAFGFIEHRPRVGFFVHARSAADLADIHHWREILEDEAFRMAVPCLTPGDITQMRELCDQMRQLASPEQRGEYLTVNRRFHFVVFRLAGSDRLLRFLVYLWDLAAPYTFARPGGPGAGSEAGPGDQHDHDRLVDLLEAGDVDGAIKAMARHRDNSLPAPGQAAR
jgi:DNA-binding GntR family transcriptional regulator